MTDYYQLRSGADDDASADRWNLTHIANRQVLAYGPVSFRGPALYQEVIWRIDASRTFCSLVLVEDLYKDHA